MHDPEKSELRQSSREAAEQSRATGCGAGGAKAGDQGERGSAKHAPDTEPGARDPGAGPRTASRRQRKKGQFTTLLHHINADTLRTAFYALKRKAAAGVDGITWHDYEADLEPRIEDLHGRVHRGAYRPQSSRRTYIPKADGKQRPLAIAALEDAFRALHQGNGARRPHARSRRPDRLRNERRSCRLELPAVSGAQPIGSAVLSRSRRGRGGRSRAKSVRHASTDFRCPTASSSATTALSLRRAYPNDHLVNLTWSPILRAGEGLITKINLERRAEIGREKPAAPIPRRPIRTGRRLSLRRRGHSRCGVSPCNSRAPQRTCARGLRNLPTAASAPLRLVPNAVRHPRS